MQSNQEAKFRASQSLFDLSQRGNGQALRNTFINGLPARISGTSKLPMEVCVMTWVCMLPSALSRARAQGEFELDYSTFMRPPGHAVAIEDHHALYEVQVCKPCFSSHILLWLRWFDAMQQVSLLNVLRMWNYSSSSADLIKNIVQGQYCKADQLVDWTLAVLEHPSLATFLPERRSIWAEDLFIFGHEMVHFRSRRQAFADASAQVVDWTNLWSSCSRLPYANLKAITNRIGILQLFNPLYVEGYYELDLEDRSHAIVARVLVDLSVKEPGENWIDETFCGRPFELPATWVEKIPDKGLLTLRYTVESWAIKRKARMAWSKYFQVAEFTEAGDDDFLGCCSCKLLPLLLKKGREARIDLGWIKLRNTISGDINVALFAQSDGNWDQSCDATTHTARHGPLERQETCIPDDLLASDDFDESISQHAGWRPAGKFCFGVHVIAGRSM
jgi:hypothetical protein